MTGSDAFWSTATCSRGAACPWRAGVATVRYRQSSLGTWLMGQLNVTYHNPHFDLGQNLHRNSWWPPPMAGHHAGDRQPSCCWNCPKHLNFCWTSIGYPHISGSMVRSGSPTLLLLQLGNLTCSLAPSHGSTGWGGRNRLFPTGGAAYGTCNPIIPLSNAFYLHLVPKK